MRTALANDQREPQRSLQMWDTLLVMRRIATALILISGFVLPSLAQKGSPFIGRWDFNITTPRGTGASWLGISEKDGKLSVWYQPTGGNVFELRDVKVVGSHLVLGISPNGNRPGVIWELEARGDQLVGVQKRGDTSVPLTGVRAPELNRAEPKTWNAPEPLFNGKNLEGWEPIGDPKNSHWTVKEGMLVNDDHGANLKSIRKFNDLKLHFEVLCPEHANSGFYLRGRYEVQIESEPLEANPPERRIGSIYGRLTPKEMPRKSGV